jgi:hypothetical protein
VRKLVASFLACCFAAFGSTQWITAVTPGTPRNNFTGYVGLSLTVGPSSITINALGRYCLSGNTNSHTIYLSQNNGATLATTSITCPGNANAFVYGCLTTPYVMAASTTYYLMTNETNGGDTWYDDNTSVTTTAVATDNYSIYSGSPNSGILLNTLGHTFVPPTFQYAGSCQSTGKVGRLIGFGQ